MVTHAAPPETHGRSTGAHTAERALPLQREVECSLAAASHLLAGMEPLIHGQPHPSSPGEQALHRAHSSGLLRGVWGFNGEIYGHLVDLVEPYARLIVEVDGWTYHRSHEAFCGDRERDRCLQVLGYQVFRYPHSEVISNLPTVIAEINGAWEARMERQPRKFFPVRPREGECGPIIRG